VLPTPLDRAPRFSAAVGREVLIKRDDVGSIGYAGNKVRKIEFIAAQADADGVGALVIVGAVQSNAARAVAAFAAATGRRCVIAIPSDPVTLDRPEGNLLLSRLFGAEVRFVGDVDWAGAENASRDICDELAADGVAALALPTGCSSPVGAAAFVSAYRELLEQLDGRRVSGIVHASSSGGTAAGLHLGRAIYGGPPVLSVDVGHLYDDPTGHVVALAGEVANVLDTDRHLSRDDIAITYDFLGGGYAQPTRDGLTALRLMAATEGVLCDPVYSAKALAAVSAGVLADDGPVVFWHTGGAQSVLTQAMSELLLG
jgi:1-aminocyclopropane-1-carboxylate deaminase/D-cysteine desulfhydrase-like pyridoxal-dependent ACC family enzyme